MSSALYGTAMLVGLPAVVGLVLPRWPRRVVGLAAILAAVVAWAGGLNVHTGSALLFFICSGIALGALVREGAALIVGRIRPARTGTGPGTLPDG